VYGFNGGGRGEGPIMIIVEANQCKETRSTVLLNKAQYGS
jgi:hypothetical protein